MKNSRMPAGRFMGELIEDLPSDYLKWVAENWEDDEIATAADEEWRWRDDMDEHFYEEGKYS